MPGYVVASVLFAACLHAVWNAIVKSASDKLLSTVLIASTAALLAALLLPWFAAPAAASWPFLAASVLVQCLYYVLLANAYRLGDMGHAYPLMRGCAPLLVAGLSGVLLGEALSARAWIGVALICAGVLGLALHGHAQRRASLLALANALVIACYTLIDGVGVRRAGSALGYTLWLYLLTGIGPLAWVLLARRAAFIVCVARGWPQALVGGAGTLTSYGIALWAMTLAPIALVAALRESSILFASVIAVALLKEPLTLRRAFSTLLIGAGAATLRLS